MTGTVSGLGGLRLPVPDPEAARAALGRLGFTVGPALHEEGALARPLVIGAAGLLATHGDTPELVLVAEDPGAAAEALEELGLNVPAPRAVETTLDLPEGDRVVRSRELRLPADRVAGPGLRLRARPLGESLLAPSWADHPNHVCGVAAMTVAVADLAAATEVWRALIGPERLLPMADSLAVALHGTLLILAEPPAIPILHPQAGRPDTAPAVAGITFEVPDPAETLALFTARGVEADGDANTVRLGPAAGLPALEFTAPDEEG